MSKEQVTPELLARIAAAFGEHRLDDVVDLFAEDGAFINARGSTPYGDLAPRRYRVYVVRAFRTVGLAI